LEVHGRAGTPLTLIARDRAAHVVQVDSTLPLSAAENRPLTQGMLSDQLGRLGGSVFVLRTLSNALEGAVILPVSELNRLRREAVRQLDDLRAAPRRWQLIEPDDVGASTAFAAVGEPDPATAPRLVVLVRSLPQLQAVLATGVETIYCDFEDPKRYREGVQIFRAAPGSPGTRSIWVAPPRIFKPGEEWILKLVRSAGADGYLVRNYDHLRFFAGERCRGDFSLNVANPLTAEYFLQRYGLERITASYDLNAAQLEALLSAMPPERCEVTIHQHMPMFHMEHCVFCAFLSDGTDYRSCGRPCDRHEVKLRDRVGLEHPLKADAGCRNTVFHARAQTGAESVGRLRALGARHFRLEFVNETPAEVAQVIDRYGALLRGEIDGTQLWRELRLHNQLGVTRGQLDREEARQVFPRAIAPLAS
jgi:putative protease